jgi:cytochrome oxidase Cu insertion factor (SCO1/SenC/PrrC family)
LVPFLTLCSDICPLTTGILLQVEESLRVDKAASRVEIVELSVDPGRDTPTRLAAYAKLTGADWQLVTEPPAELAAIAKFFGFFYQKVPEDKPPSIDWLTHQPLTYDINHSDGFVIINPRDIERFDTSAAPAFHGKLNPTLEKFLTALGHRHQNHPANPDYKPIDVLQALAWSMQVPLPFSGD